MLLSHLSVLPPSRQVALFHRLLPLVAALPSAAERTRVRRACHIQCICVVGGRGVWGE